MRISDWSSDVCSSDLDALELIYAAAEDPNCMYGSVTIQNDRLAWPMKASGAPRDAAISDPVLLPARLEVEFVPFLGMLVSRELIAKIGVPDPGFFIAQDDVEYCFRARQAGARIELVERSAEHTSELKSLMRISYAVFCLKKKQINNHLP